MLDFRAKSARSEPLYDHFFDMTSIMVNDMATCRIQQSIREIEEVDKRHDNFISFSLRQAWHLVPPTSHPNFTDTSDSGIMCLFKGFSNSTALLLQETSHGQGRRQADCHKIVTEVSKFYVNRQLILYCDYC